MISYSLYVSVKINHIIKLEWRSSSVRISDNLVPWLVPKIRSFSVHKLIYWKFC